MSQPLEGVKVIDLSRILAGPLCTMTLADFGAEVLKVENGAGDETRSWKPPVNAQGVSTYYWSVNRNKQAVIADFADAADLQALRELICEADVLVENFRPGVLAKFGLDYCSLHELNPKLVYCSISGFGEKQGAALPGFDLLVQAVGGLMSITGEPEGTPSKVGVALVDVLAAQNAVTGILLALRERDASGQGQRVSVNLLHSLLAGLTNQSSSTLATGKSPARMGNAHPSIAPYETFAVQDGVVAIAVGNDRQFAALARELGQPELADDPRFSSNSARVAHRQDLKAIIEAATAQDTAVHWAQTLMSAGVPAGKVNSIAEAIEFSKELGLDPVAIITDPATGETTEQIASPIGLSRTSAQYRSIPPAHGQHQELLNTLANQ
ncbi:MULTISPECIES: CaiB/BaiF CoA transferase family protein [Glutamicibacter]|uniref:CoA-transferase n=2 Tax=Glutamicibacter arilaitensis TaxID=256701 RepID=A0ABM9PUA4_GLUAR|nr:MULTISPECIES: CoA transferase [Glutamicibacter]CBT74816.1 putative CoA-transferase [Glutamicibacter arilaitensis Re117]HCH48996.1 CoA transferase [Glutamicibacter sp.]HCJ53990.1 CoA transferase [Glutamicibacter sp.]